MSSTNFSVKWESYHNNIRNGLGFLQQNGEFVDMTLAADGYVVKAHQIIIALASPYLKELITSVPCPHPVIFLNNISHEILCCLMQYMYTGEAMVPNDKLPLFFEACKVLHIVGLENPIYPTTTNKCRQSNATILVTNNTSSNIDTTLETVPPLINTREHIDNTENNSLDGNVIRETHYLPSVEDDQMGHTNLQDYNLTVEDDNNVLENDHPRINETTDKNTESHNSCKLQYTVSERGCLQLILNRYMYNIHHKAHNGRNRRWRCIDYRMKRCMALVDTDGELVLNRSNLHNHPFHDNKILKKIEKKSIYSALKIALENAKYKNTGIDITKRSRIPDDVIKLNECGD